MRNCLGENAEEANPSWNEIITWMNEELQRTSNQTVSLREGDFSTGIRTPEVRPVFLTYKRGDGSEDIYHFAFGAFRPPIQYLPRGGDR